MKKTYGIKSLLLLYVVMIIMTVYVPLTKYRIEYIHAHAHRPHTTFMVLNIVWVFMLVLVVYLFVDNFLRYHFVITENGMIRFTSLNPFNKPILIAMNDISAVSYSIGKKKGGFTISTRSNEMNIRARLVVSEVKKLYTDMGMAAPHIQLSGPHIEQNKKTKRIMKIIRLLSLAASLLTLLLILLHRHRIH